MALLAKSFAGSLITALGLYVSEHAESLPLQNESAIRFYYSAQFSKLYYMALKALPLIQMRTSFRGRPPYPQAIIPFK
ncbi:MAG: hypothetical protein EZS28_019463 [Streblomastix strix]|uniref:Uncharacterized protein n=1 Tax=Streblomastix strix TaxID=222440 RepID=A0A5J4VRH1_9EUKA|nr:MAG: hypothetical protein EZS28_019463 [Streblomastix strix]